MFFFKGLREDLNPRKPFGRSQNELTCFSKTFFQKCFSKTFFKKRFLKRFFLKVSWKTWTQGNPSVAHRISTVILIHTVSMISGITTVRICIVLAISTVRLSKKKLILSMFANFFYFSATKFWSFFAQIEKTLIKNWF